MSDTMQETVARFEGNDADEFAALLADYNAAKALAKEMKQEQEKAEARIREMMGDSNSAYIGEKLVATINIRNRSNVNRKALEAGWPEALKACLTHTVYTVLETQD